MTAKSKEYYGYGNSTCQAFIGAYKRVLSDIEILPEVAEMFMWLYEYDEKETSDFNVIASVKYSRAPSTIAASLKCTLSIKQE